MCYGQLPDEAISNVERLAIEVIADRISQGELPSSALSVSFTIRMSNWPASKVRRVLAALERIGERVKRKRGYHRLLTRLDWQDYEFAFHNKDELGLRMLTKFAKRTD